MHARPRLASQAPNDSRVIINISHEVLVRAVVINTRLRIITSRLRRAIRR